MIQKFLQQFIFRELIKIEINYPLLNQLKLSTIKSKNFQ